MSAADKTNLDKSVKNITYFMQSGGAGLILTKNDGTEGSLGLPVAGSTVNGLMSIADKTKLDGIASEANKYVHPTAAGNKHIPAGGSSGQVLKWSSAGTAVWGTEKSAFQLKSNGIINVNSSAAVDINEGGVYFLVINGAANPIINLLLVYAYKYPDGNLKFQSLIEDPSYITVTRSGAHTLSLKAADQPMMYKLYKITDIDIS